MVPEDENTFPLNEHRDTDTSLESHPSSPPVHQSDTFETQTELAELESFEASEKTEGSPKHDRYSSPLFQKLLTPIAPVKISKPTIPEDDSINNLLHVASLVSKTQKIPENSAPLEKTEVEILTPTNKANIETEEQAIDDRLLKKLSVPEKRPSLQDPEKVLMENVVPGEDIFCAH